jgi:mannose-6-phosphate isomerase-like protein (cupin superfamily)
MKAKIISVVAISAAALVAAASLPALGAGESGGATMTAASDLQWKDMGIPGVASATVSGDMEKGPSRFFLRYPAGFVTPAHHHSADHYVTVVSGTITLTAGGKERKLGPGSYFALTGKASHVAKVEGGEPALFFIQADSAWDVVMEK